MAGRKKAEDGLKVRLPVGFTEKERELIEKKVGGNLQSASDVVRHYFKKGFTPVRNVPAIETRSLPRLWPVSCGTPIDLSVALDDPGLHRTEISDPALLKFCTPHAFTALANGSSMRDAKLPDSISDGDELLFVPLDEYKEGLHTGNIVLVELELKNGDRACTLKEWTGKILKANNPKFKAPTFGGDVLAARALAVCVGRLAKVL